jgi:hypothetical protein
MSTTLIAVDKRFFDTSLRAMQARPQLAKNWTVQRESAPMFGEYLTYKHNGQIAFEIHRHYREVGYTISPAFFHANDLWCPCGSH